MLSEDINEIRYKGLDWSAARLMKFVSQGVPDAQMKRGIPDRVQRLLLALKFRAADREGLRSLADSDWRRLLEFCDLAHMTFPLWRVCNNVMPPWVLERIEQNALDNERRFMRIQEIYQEAAHAFESAGLEFVVLKGFAQYPGYVEIPQLRMQSDIDIYCKDEVVAPARDLLLTLGYEPQNNGRQDFSDHLPTMMRRTTWEWRGNHFDPEMPPSVELHHTLWNETIARFRLNGVDEFWSRRTSRQVGNIAFPGLDEIDNFGFSALHILRDLFLGEGHWIINRVYEIARFMHTNTADNTFWSRWKQQHDDELRAHEAIVLRLARDWFACDIPEQVITEIGQLPREVDAWLETFGDSPIEVMFHPSKASLWLHVALIDSPREKIDAVRRAILPTRMPPIGAPGQDTTRDGRRKRFLPSSQWGKYIFYLSSRAHYHARTILPTLIEGTRWWFASRNPFLHS